MNKITIRIGNEDLILETGKMAKQANGSIFASYGGSSVLTTVCCSSTTTEGMDFVPLQVEYNERYYAAGKIPGGFLKREARPKDKEILVCRLIDRPLRPLFSKKFGREIQIVPTVVSTDQKNMPDMIAMVAASAAVTISDIPFDGPVGGVRVGSINGEYIINPTFQQLEECEMDIIVAGTKDGITMVEGGAKEVSEELMLGAIEAAHKVIIEICDAQLKLAEMVGVTKLPLPTEEATLVNEEEITAFATPLFEKTAFIKDKLERYEENSKVKEAISAKFTTESMDDLDKKKLSNLIGKIHKNIVRKSVLDSNVRIDGRGPEDIRKITCEIGVLSRTHGSALFTRGETQSLGVITLGTADDEKMVDDIDGPKSYENFMLHYNFPPYSVGETGRMMTGRREIGHGHLAQRALEGVLPTKDDFPYTVRVVSEILESNGSSSMATVCSGTLAMLEAGVPLKKPVSGIAMGLISDGERAVVLSDILGDEDHLGDMDFKVCGTEDGITAFQMDIKIDNISQDLMKKALSQAKAARLHILGIMNDTISKPNEDVNEYAPKITSIKIDADKIGAVIGSGGKVIKGIQETTGADLNIDDNGFIRIYGPTKAAADEALAMVKGIVIDPEPGTIYQGVVKKIMDFGAFVEFLPGKEGLVHISKLSNDRVEKVSDILKEGQEIPVKLLEIDQRGRLNLSYKDAIEGEDK